MRGSLSDTYAAQDMLTFMLHTQMLGLEGNYLHTQKKARYETPTVNIILIGERLKALSLRSQTRQECPFSPLLFNITLEF